MKKKSSEIQKLADALSSLALELQMLSMTDNSDAARPQAVSAAARARALMPLTLELDRLRGGDALSPNAVQHEIRRALMGAQVLQALPKFTDVRDRSNLLGERIDAAIETLDSIIFAMDDGEHPMKATGLGEGEWLMPPRSLTDIANRMKNIPTRKARTILKQYGLRNFPPDNRQSWTVRIDLMPTELRNMILAS